MQKVNRDNAVDVIKNSIDIVDVISEAVELKKSGKYYKASCPFHSEKTPSFTVFPDKQNFKCFGCGEGGDVFTFMEKYYGMSFVEALEKLAERANIELVGGYQDSRKEERKRLYKINRDAAEYFFRNLWKKDSNGYTYIQARGFKREALRDFAVGYAGWEEQGLYDFLIEKGYSEEEMFKAQLVKKYDGEPKDFFRNRIMFPIRDARGNFVAFGGRDVIMPGEKAYESRPKYLNTSDYFLFKKSRIIYGLFQSMETIRRTGEAILVEGYMDVMALHQHGLSNAVASMGTAFTEDQAALLKKHAKKVYLCYDSDEAGTKAAESGGMELKRQGMMIKVIHITDGKDPDDFLKKRGREAFEQLMEKAEDYETFRISNMAKSRDFQQTQDKVNFIEQVAGFLKNLNPAEQSVYAKETADKYPVSELAIKKQIEAYERNAAETRARQGSGFERRVKREKEALKEPAISSVEAEVLNILYRNSDMLEQIDSLEIKKLMKSRAAKAMLHAIEGCVREGREPSRENILKDIEDDEIKRILIGKVLDADPIKAPNALFIEELISNVRIMQIDEEMAELQEELEVGQGIMSADREKEIVQIIASLAREKVALNDARGL